MDNSINKSSDSVEADFQKYLDGFIPILTQELDSAIEKYKKDAEIFYASEESHIFEKFAIFRSDFIDEFNNNVIKKGMRYLGLDKIYTLSELEEKVYKTEGHIYRDKFDITTCNYYLSSREYDFFGGCKSSLSFYRTVNELYGKFCDSEKEIAKKEIIKNSFKPLRVVSGFYGECDDCLCHDEEFDVFFYLTPDDNYYHWNWYEISPCSITVLKEDGNKVKTSLEKSKRYVSLYPKYDIFQRIEYYEKAEE